MTRVKEESRPLTRAISVRDVARAEITKGLTQPVILLVCLVVLVINTALFTLASTDFVRISGASGLVDLSAMGAVMLAPVYVFIIIPACLAGSEYVDGQLRVTLTAVPDRMQLIAGKLAAAVAMVVPGAGIVLLPGRVIFAVSENMSLLATLTDLVCWVAAYTLLSFVAYSLAVLTRSRVAPVAALALIPLLIATGVLPFADIVRLLPDQLALSLVGTPGFDVTALAPAVAAVLLSIWVLTLGVAQAVAFLMRDG